MIDINAIHEKIASLRALGTDTQDVEVKAAFGGLPKELPETISAFATVGLTTGITPELPDFARIWLVVLMYLVRIGPITVVAALAARTNRRLYSFPVERPFIG